jgi:hypothetical protein
VLKERLVLKVLKEFKVHKVDKVLKGPLVPKVRLDLKELKVQ